MGDCEVCGNGEERFVVLIEGAKMRVCGDCARRGRILSSTAPVAPRRPGVPRSPAPVKEIEIVADCAERIKRAREKMHVNTDVLAERVFEKESYLRRVENGETLPNEALARRLEKELGITLFEASGDDGEAQGGRKTGPVTLGDLIIVKKKQGKV